uniref:B3 domain-containing transcription repressor VAL1 n=1 Tax=Vitis vinifera TaxID=29760 RepID=F6GUB3_VITVI
MGSRICKNKWCGTTASFEWKKGWTIKSGAVVDLCYKCGSAYENLVFCETFHQEEDGWRQCSLCHKRIHCGCIVSNYQFEALDYGGVRCSSCLKSPQCHPVRSNDETPNEFGTSTANSINNLQHPCVENRMNCNIVGKDNFMQLGKTMEADELNHLLQSQKGDANVSLGQIKQDDSMHAVREVNTIFPTTSLPSIGPSEFAKSDNSIPMLMGKDVYESLVQPSLNISLSSSSGPPNFLLPFPGNAVEGMEHSKSAFTFQQGQRTRHILPKPPNSSLSIGSEANKSMVPEIRIARPPAEGRGRNQLLPRYWPRITDQELQQLSGDLNSTIVPLFEKVLSASDAGRIGRLVLPKACAEAYFPPISQSEGLPLRVQDAKGTEWTFQFRFWPNNNSRMYVLEGVTPCIQSMQLRAGDTVIFSRIDPGNKLVIGCRKASNCVDVQDAQTSALSNGTIYGGSSFSSVTENLSTCAGKMNEDSPQQSLLIPEKKRTRNIGSKNKRLLMHSEDALELKITWQETQDILRPPPSVEPNIVTIEGYEIEEYTEPPVFGKRSIFTARPSGGQDQWGQCDNCSKWRKLPIDVFLPLKWTCADNIWDLSRCSCSAPDEWNPKESESLSRLGKDYKRQKSMESHKLAQEGEPTGLDALANAAVLEENGGDSGEPSAEATTRHPRHRPGCSCIVCIQPPSGKGKHKSTCICNVCMTVKRRFRTLMLRKKKRQSEHEAESSQIKHQIHPINESEISGMVRNVSLQRNHSDGENNQSKIQEEVVAETGTGQIDLNCRPDNEEDLLPGVTGVSMTSLVQAASHPLDFYLKQTGLTSLISDQPMSSNSRPLPQVTGGEDGHLTDERSLSPLIWEHGSGAGEGYHKPDLD